LSLFKKYHLSGNLKFIYQGIFQSLELRILVEKNLSISPKLNFTTNTLGRYGLRKDSYTFKHAFKDILWKKTVKGNFKPAMIASYAKALTCKYSREARKRYLVMSCEAGITCCRPTG